jgi:hypothetical protein
MLPLALGTGPGADERRAIAVVVIGGQTLSLLLTLIVTPVAYSLFEDLAATPAWSRFSEAVYVLTHPLRKVRQSLRGRKAPEVAASGKLEQPTSEAGSEAGARGD